MSSPLMPTYNGFVGSNFDALLIIEASLNNELPLVSRRPAEQERGHLIKSGSVFVFVEKSSEIKRWTDGIAWSASRILGRFLIYRALDKFTDRVERRRNRKNSKDSIKKDEESTETGYVDRYLGFSDRFTYGRDMNPSKNKQNCGHHESLDYAPTTSFKVSSSKHQSLTGIYGTQTDHGLHNVVVAPSKGKPRPSKPSEYSPSRDLVAPQTVGANLPSVAHPNGALIVDNGLIKKTISLTIYPDAPGAEDSDDGQTVHLISYFSAHDVLTGKILRPSQTALKNLTVSPRVWKAMKRSSLGGKFPLENEANFFLDRNYQLQNMSILTCPDWGVTQAHSRQSDGAINTNRLPFPHPSAVPNKPPAAEDQHHVQVQPASNSRFLPTQPGSFLFNNSKCSTTNNTSNQKASQTLKKPRMFNEIDPRITGLESQFHYPEASIENIPLSDIPDMHANNLSSSLNRQSQCPPVSSEAKADANSFSIPLNTVGRSEKNGIESSSFVDTTIPVNTETSSMNETLIFGHYSPAIPLTHVPSHEGFFPNLKNIEAQNAPVGHLTGYNNTLHNQIPETHQNYSHSTSLYQVQGDSTRDFSSLDDPHVSHMIHDSLNGTFPRPEHTFSSVPPFSANNTLDTSKFDLHIHNSSDKMDYLVKESSSLPKKDLSASTSASHVASTMTSHTKSEDNNYFNSDKTF